MLGFRVRVRSSRFILTSSKKSRKYIERLGSYRTLRNALLVAGVGMG